jgi:hypothetical protein
MENCQLRAINTARFTGPPEKYDQDGRGKAAVDQIDAVQ